MSALPVRTLQPPEPALCSPEWDHQLGQSLMIQVSAVWATIKGPMGSFPGPVLCPWIPYGFCVHGLARPVGEETQVEDVKVRFRDRQYHHTRSFQKYPSQPPFWKTLISVGHAEGHLLTPGWASWIQNGRISTTLCWLQARCKLFSEKKHVPHASRLKRQPQAGTLTPAAAPSHWKPGLHLHSQPSPVTHTLSNDVLIKVVLAALWIIICVKICSLKAFTHPLSIWSFLLVLFLPSGCQKTERACDSPRGRSEPSLLIKPLSFQMLLG